MEQKEDLTRNLREFWTFFRELREINDLQTLAEEHRLRGDYNDAKWLWITKNREQQNRGLKQEPYPEHLKSFDNFRRRNAGTQFRLNTQPFEKPITTKKQFLERFSKRKQERHWET